MHERPLLDSSRVLPRAAAAIHSFQSSALAEIQSAILSHDVVVVGMAHNPYVKKARNALTQAKISFKYLGYGNYFNLYSLRVAIKMWSGWSTFPQVFVKGNLIGGADDLIAEIADGTFQNRLKK